MAERCNFTTPQGAARSQSATATVASLTLDWEGARIIAKFVGNNGHRFGAEWDGAEATSLMVALNRANLTMSSLHKRVINQALRDNKIPDGTISGNPD